MSLISRFKQFLECFRCGNALLFVRNYLERSRFRACRFLVDSEVACWERFIWFVVIVLGAFCVVSMSCIISIRYKANYLTTVIDNTHHSVADIPFPAVTLCHYNRIDSRKVDAAIKKFLPNSSQFEQKMLRVLLQRMNELRFGSFGKLHQLREYDYRSLNHLNLSEVFQFTAYTCEDLLRECWWRSRRINCCDLFSQAESEYGYCHSFNSESAPVTQYERENPTILWPLQTYKYGMGTGLRIVYRIDFDGYQEADREAGVTVIVHNNGEWPTNGRFVPAGNAVSIAIEASQYKTSKKLRVFAPEDRQCYFDDVSITDEINDEVMHIRGLPYLRANCIVACRRYYLMKYCNCSVDFFYPDYGYPSCTVTGLQCLSYLNSILTFEKPKKSSAYFSDTEVGISCNCLPECFRVEYRYALKPNMRWQADNISVTDISIYFKRQKITRFRTEKAYQFSHFLANFGGIVSFFFGASILSVAEAIYFAISNGLSRLIRWIPWGLFRPKVTNAPSTNPVTVNTITELPQ